MKESHAVEGTSVDAPRLRSTATIVGRSFSFRFGSQVLSALINVAGMVLVGNHLAASGYGEYAFYYALVPLIATLTDLGVGVIVTREVARERTLGARYLGDAILVKTVVGLALLLGVVGTAPFLLDPQRALLVCLVAATSLVDYSQDVGMWMFRAHDRQDFEALLLLVSQIVWLSGIALCAALHTPLALFLACATIAFSIRLIIGAWIVRRRMYRPLFEPNWERIRGLIAEGLPFGLAMFAVVFYGRAGVMLLKGLATNADVGYFNVGYMLSQPLGFISSSFNISVFPSLSRASQAGVDRVRPLLRNAVKFQLLVAIPLAVGLALLSERVIPILFHGSGFRQAGAALKTISLGLPLIFLNLNARYVLAALEEQRAYLRAILVGLVVNVGVGVVLIHEMGFMGACVGLLAGELAVFLACRWTLRGYLSTADVLREAWKPLVAALGMGLVVYPLRTTSLFLAPVVGVITYVVLLLLLRALSRRELDVLRGVYVSFRLPGSAFLARMNDPS